METIQNIKEELNFFAVTESINWNYDLSQENHRYCYGFNQKMYIPSFRRQCSAFAIHRRLNECARKQTVIIVKVGLKCGKTNACRRSLIKIIRRRHDVGLRNIHRDVRFP